MYSTLSVVITIFCHHRVACITKHIHENEYACIIYQFDILCMHQPINIYVLSEIVPSLMKQFDILARSSIRLGFITFIKTVMCYHDRKLGNTSFATCIICKMNTSWFACS